VSDTTVAFNKRIKSYKIVNSELNKLAAGFIGAFLEQKRRKILSFSIAFTASIL